jgi:hypothetical protein
MSRAKRSIDFRLREHERAPSPQDGTRSQVVPNASSMKLQIRKVLTPEVGKDAVGSADRL